MKIVEAMKLGYEVEVWTGRLGVVTITVRNPKPYIFKRYHLPAFQAENKFDRTNECPIEEAIDDLILQIKYELGKQ